MTYTFRKPAKRAQQVSSAELKVALRFASSMQRLSVEPSQRWSKSSWRAPIKYFERDNRGQYILNPLRMVPFNERKGIDVIMEHHLQHHGCTRTIYNVDPHIIWSCQNVLHRQNLFRVIHHFNAAITRPNNKQRVTCCQWRNKLVLWNGNHRVAATILLGRKVPEIRLVDIDKMCEAV